MQKICVKILIILQQSICQVFDDKAFNNQLDEDEGFMSGERSDNKVWQLRIMQQYNQRNKQRILDTDYNFNWNAGYESVELLHSTIIWQG